jgi:hypothetical protein
MMDKQNEQVDFSNVTFGDFGRLSPAQKVGFVVTLPIALPLFVLVKVFTFIGINNYEDHTETRTSVGPEAGAAASTVFGALAEAAVKQMEEDDYPERYSAGYSYQYDLDREFYGEEYAEMKHGHY